MATATVCVIGGGPAGATIAKNLAALGYDVVLVAGERPRHGMGESLTPACLALLATLRLDGAAERAAYRAELGSLVLWDTEDAVVRAAHTLLVDRPLFDGFLRKAAKDAGVRVQCPATAGAPRRAADGSWRVPVRSSAGIELLTCGFLVDARGRRGGAAARPTGPRTAVMVGQFRGPQGYPDGSRIEAGPDAWIWGCPSPGGSAAACFVDARRLAGCDAGRRSALFMRLLARSRLFDALASLPMVAPPSVAPASASLACDVIGSGCIRVGDAAVATNPLSSQGVQAALVSALQGAAVMHTILTRPEDSDLAAAFYRQRRESASRRAQRHAGGFCRAAYHRFGTDFWRARASAEAAAAVFPSTGSGDAPLRLCEQLRVLELPVLEGALIRRRRAISHPALGEPVAYLGDIALAPLLEAIRFPAPPAVLLRDWSERVGPAAARHVLAWMQASKLLVA